MDVNPGNNSSTADITLWIETDLYKDSSSEREEKMMPYSGVDPRAQPCLLILLWHPALNRLPGSQTPVDEGKVSGHPACLEGESFQLSDLQH